MRTETFHTEAAPKLRVRLPSGDVRLETSDASEVVVELEGPREGEAVIEQRGNEIVIDIEKKGFFSSGGDHRVVVKAPHDSSVEAKVASADISGRGRFGLVEVKSASGDVSFDEAEAVEISTASGDVELGRVSGPGKLRSASGDVELRELAGDLRVQTASGDVRLAAVSSGKLKVQSASGDVEVGVARGSAVWMDVSSMSGDTSCELDARDEPPADDKPLVEIEARTMSGDVEIKRA
jgi:DUF4097 and DUF4098 domain-containing protein YvlB